MMDGLERGAYGVLACYPGGGVAAVERNYASARELAGMTLRRFQHGVCFVDSLPRHPGALHDDYADAYTVRFRLPRGQLELALVRFHEDHVARVPLSEPQVLAIRGAGLLKPRCCSTAVVWHGRQPRHCVTACTSK